MVAARTTSSYLAVACNARKISIGETAIPKAVNVTCGEKQCCGNVSDAKTRSKGRE